MKIQTWYQGDYIVKLWGCTHTQIFNTDNVINARRQTNKGLWEEPWGDWFGKGEEIKTSFCRLTETHFWTVTPLLKNFQELPVAYKYSENPLTWPWRPWFARTPSSKCGVINSSWFSQDLPMLVLRVLLPWRAPQSQANQDRWSP